jgi:thymidylate synthase (FAD)
MKLIKPSFEIWEQSVGLEGVYKQIERVGRVCYKSEDKITEDSAKPFVDRMIKSGHGAMLEHGTVYMFMPIGCDKHDYHVAWKYHKNKYSKVIIRNEHFLLNKNGYYITTNLRVLVENGWLDDLKYICDPTEFHERRVCVHFVCDRGILAEFTRHRVFSFSAESTRYCNYSKNKFGNEVTFIEPCWSTTEPMRDGFSEFRTALAEAENHYLFLIENGWKPQQARAVLPNSLKTELVMTGFVSDWKHFFRLRSRIAETGKPHPQAQELADPLMDEFVKRGIMETLL